MTFTLQHPTTFSSPSNPSHKIQYTLLNPGASHTLLLSYGAGGRSIDLTLYQSFISTHSSLSLLCVDRWTLPSEPSNSQNTSTTVSRTGAALLSELSSITIELLDFLKIEKFSVAAHSAGAYQMLDLVTRCNASGRVDNVFPICTHIPAPFTSSRVMLSMCTMPEFLFKGITKLDSSLADTQAERLFLKVIGSQKADRNDQEKFIDSPELRKLLEEYKPSEEQVALRKEREDLDYRLGYTRIPGIGMGVLTGFYTGVKLGADVEVTWFTCEADIFFGPASVERIAKEMRGVKIEVVNVNEASHADIFMRTEVWEEIYRRVVKG